MLFEEIEKCSIFCANSTVITQDIWDIASRALFNVSFDAVKRKCKSKEVIADKEGLKLYKDCDRQ